MLVHKKGKPKHFSIRRQNIKESKETIRTIHIAVLVSEQHNETTEQSPFIHVELQKMAHNTKPTSFLPLNDYHLSFGQHFEEISGKQVVQAH